MARGETIEWKEATERKKSVTFVLESVGCRKVALGSSDVTKHSNFAITTPITAQFQRKIIFSINVKFRTCEEVGS
jgi:hypothetical protein